MDDGEDLQQFLARLLTKKFWKAKLTWANAFRALLLVGVLLCLRYLGAAFASVLGIFLIFWNLGEGGGGASAYSVFNRGANYLLGDLRLQRLDQQLRNGDAAVEDEGNVVAYRPPVELKSRDANKKCPCGSGRKLKKCYVHLSSACRLPFNAFLLLWGFSGLLQLWGVASKL